MLTKILVAIDASGGALSALEEAATLARLLGFELDALWVEQPLIPAAMFVDFRDAVRDRV